MTFFSQAGEEVAESSPPLLRYQRSGFLSYSTRYVPISFLQHHLFILELILSLSSPGSSRFLTFSLCTCYIGIKNSVMCAYIHVAPPLSRRLRHKVRERERKIPRFPKSGWYWPSKFPILNKSSCLRERKIKSKSNLQGTIFSPIKLEGEERFFLPTFFDDDARKWSSYHIPISYEQGHRQGLPDLLYL